MSWPRAHPDRIGTRATSRNNGCVTFLVPLVGLLPAFGAEAIFAPADDLPSWHHRRLSQTAAAQAGWSPPAAREVARHADRIDRMLFNPLWIARGGPRRWAASQVGRRASQEIHFDDLPGTALVRAAWQRYLAGAGCALRWSATLPDPVGIGVARCAVGYLLHAVQDFYAHSSWIDDPDRRSHTWQEREVVGDVYTCTVKLPVPKPHGSFGLRSAEHPLPADIPLRDGLTLPREIGGMSAGITLDSRWQAAVGVRERGIELTGDEAFEIATGLAQRSSSQALESLGSDLAQAGYGSWWDRVQHARESADPQLAAEHPGLMPQEFFAAGAGPSLEPDGDSWFLRVTSPRRVGLPSWAGRGVRGLGPFRELPSRRVPPGWRAVAFKRGATPEVSPQVVVLR